MIITIIYYDNNYVKIYFICNYYHNLFYLFFIIIIYYYYYDNSDNFIIIKKSIGQNDNIKIYDFFISYKIWLIFPRKSIIIVSKNVPKLNFDILSN